MLPLGALMIVLARPIVRVIYERYAFDQAATQLTTSVLITYAVGMFVYLGRDVLVRVFYALGDGDTPFRISTVNIFLNALLDYLLVRPLGAPGLVLATVGVNLISMVVLLWFLHRKLNGLPWRSWMAPILGLTGASVLTGLASWGVLQGLEQIFAPEGLLIQLVQLCIAGAIGLGIFALLATQLRLPEVDLLINRIRQRFFPRN
jgi:putative peptidoglycan lipid II flippase